MKIFLSFCVLRNVQNRLECQRKRKRYSRQFLPIVLKIKIITVNQDTSTGEFKLILSNTWNRHTKNPCTKLVGSQRPTYKAGKFQLFYKLKIISWSFMKLHLLIFTKFRKFIHFLPYFRFFKNTKTKCMNFESFQFTSSHD